MASLTRCHLHGVVDNHLHEPRAEGPHSVESADPFLGRTKAFCATSSAKEGWQDQVRRLGRPGLVLPYQHLKPTEVAPLEALYDPPLPHPQPFLWSPAVVYPYYIYLRRRKIFDPSSPGAHRKLITQRRRRAILQSSPIPSSQKSGSLASLGLRVCVFFFYHFLQDFSISKGKRTMPLS